MSLVKKEIKQASKKDSAKLCLTLEIPWIIAWQVPLSMGIPRQEYWSGLPFPFPGELPDPEIDPRSPTVQADALPTELPGRWVKQEMGTAIVILECI